MTFNILKTGTSIVTVTDDDSVLTNKISAAVNAFNSFNSYLQNQRAIPTNGTSRPPLATDPMLRSVNRQLRDSFTGDHVVSGSSFKNMAELGITFDRNGKLAIDSTTLSDAIANHRSDVQAFLSDSTSGFGTIVNNLLDSYTKSGGAIETIKGNLNNTITNIDSRISAMENQMTILEASLTAQFTAADQAISQLNNEAGSLTSLSTGYRLY
jgi:flagellar hook-associated protein 2